MRQETQANLDRERAIADALEVLWNVKLRKLPNHYNLDFVMCVENKAKGFVEIKGCHKHAFQDLQKFGGYTINLNKIERAVSLMELTGLEFRLVVDSQGEVWAARFTELSVTGDVFVFGRTDRPTQNDQEPNIKIPLSLFKKLPITIREKSSDKTQAA